MAAICSLTDLGHADSSRTGTAVSIGSISFLTTLEQSPEPVVIVDKRAYAGNLGSVASVRRKARRYRVQPDISGAHNVARSDVRSRTLPPKPHRSHREFIVTSVIGTYSLTKPHAFNKAVPPIWSHPNYYRL
jgi:hypothetical protein